MTGFDFSGATDLHERFASEWYAACCERAWTTQPQTLLERELWWSMRWVLGSPEMVRLWARDPERAFADWMHYLWSRDYFASGRYAADADDGCPG